MNDRRHTYMLYARVSPKGSDWHAEETTIAMQLQEMRSYIREKDPQAQFFEQSDEFRSGKDLNRPGIRAVLADLDLPECPWGTLVIWALDRLSRSLIDAVPIFEHLRDANCGFVCVRQAFLSTEGAMARFALNQTIAMAQFEREMTSERVKAKMVYIAAQGKMPSGRLPLGYRRKPGVKNVIEPDPETVPIVRDIFAAYISQREPVADLRRRYSQYLAGKNQLYRLLRNRIYIGEIEYDGAVYPGAHEPIISREIFERAAAMLPGTRRAPRPHAQKYRYLLQGLVFCRCGKKMVPYSVTKSSGKRYHYYKCQDVLGCKYAVNAEKLDAAVLDAVKRLAVSEEYVKGCYDEYRREQAEASAGLKQLLAASNREISESEAKEKKITDLFLAGVVSSVNAEIFNAQLAEAHRQTEHLREKRQRLVDELAKIKDDPYPDLLGTLRSWADILDLDPDDFTVKRNLILAIVSSVTCLPPDDGSDDDPGKGPGGDPDPDNDPTPRFRLRVMFNPPSDRHFFCSLQIL